MLPWNPCLLGKAAVASPACSARVGDSPASLARRTGVIPAEPGACGTAALHPQTGGPRSRACPSEGDQHARGWPACHVFRSDSHIPGSPPFPSAITAPVSPLGLDPAEDRVGTAPAAGTSDGTARATSTHKLGHRSAGAEGSSAAVPAPLFPYVCTVRIHFSVF